MLDRTPPSPRLRPIVLSTDSWIPQTRCEAWRDEFALRIARVDVNTPDKDAFAADISVLPLPHIAISKTAVAPCSLTRTRSLIRDGDDGLVFILCLEGEADIRFGEDHVHLRPSTGTLVSNHRLGGFFSTTKATTSRCVSIATLPVPSRPHLTMRCCGRHGRTTRQSSSCSPILGTF
jgi:hypothetical protein